MPSFGRLGKHGNRSQHALPEQLSTAAASASQSQSAGSNQAQVQQWQGGAGVPVADLATQGNSPAGGAPHLALSANTALSSVDQLETSAALDARALKHQQQQQQQQHQHHLQQEHQFQSALPSATAATAAGTTTTPFPPTLPAASSPANNYNTLSGTFNLAPILQTSGLGGPPAFDGHQSQTPIDSDSGAVNRAQSQRHGTPLTPQHHQQSLYGIASSSIDILTGTGVYQQQQQATPAPAPQKRSTRKLIKGIFGSNRDPHENYGQQQSSSSTQSIPQNFPGPYNNTAGLARRPSKRVSNNSPNSKAGSLPVTQLSTDRDWQSQGPYNQQQAPQLQNVGEIDEYSLEAYDSNVNSPTQDSRFPFHKDGSRQVSREHLVTSVYDEVYEPPDHPPPQQQQQQPQSQSLQRSGTIRVHEQQPSQYDAQQQKGATFDSSAQQERQPAQQHFHYPTGSQNPYQQSGEPRLTTSQLASGQQVLNAETVSQLSHESIVTESEARSIPGQHQSRHQPPQASGQEHAPVSAEDISSHLAASQGASYQNQDQSITMTPQATGASSISNRRAHDAEKAHRGQADVPPVPPPGYHRQGSGSANTMSPLTTPGQEQGRSSPQPSDTDPDLKKQFKDLLTKYKNVKRLYFDGKALIEHLHGQVEQLQNAVANQRMSQSRTAWDDNEYSTRFNRLNGAITNLAFNIRKDWRSLPSWLAASVSADALKTGKQEMTAVGRAVVSKWLVDELFNRCFHPSLDPQLSQQLKDIEMSIRGNSHTLHSQEELNALTTKVVNWRMTTLDGLQGELGSPEALDHRTMMTSKVTTNLTAYLYQFLSVPPPPGVEGGSSMITELAVAIAANLPLESRDVAISFPLPGDAVQTSIMEIEKTGLPPLEGKKDLTADPGSDSDEMDRDGGGQARADKGKLGQSKELGKVRLAAFVALEVRGRQVLGKAPVWTL